MKRRFAIPAAVALVALVATAVALATGGSLGQAQKATVAYKDVEQGDRGGLLVQLPDKAGNTCIAQPPQGGMGVHMVNKKLLDGTIDASKPEAMVYAPAAGGKMDLVAIEYVVFKSAWKGSSAPSLFGRQFALTPAGTASVCRRTTRCTRGSTRRTRAGCSLRGTRRSAASSVSRIRRSGCGRPRQAPAGSRCGRRRSCGVQHELERDARSTTATATNVDEHRRRASARSSREARAGCTCE